MESRHTIVNIPEIFSLTPFHPPFQRRPPIVQKKTQATQTDPPKPSHPRPCKQPADPKPTQPTKNHPMHRNHMKTSRNHPRHPVHTTPSRNHPSHPVHTTPSRNHPSHPVHTTPSRNHPVHHEHTTPSRNHPSHHVHTTPTRNHPSHPVHTTPSRNHPSHPEHTTPSRNHPVHHVHTTPSSERNQKPPNHRRSRRRRTKWRPFRPTLSSRFLILNSLTKIYLNMYVQQHSLFNSYCSKECICCFDQDNQPIMTISRCMRLIRFSCLSCSDIRITK